MNRTVCKQSGAESELTARQNVGKEDGVSDYDSFLDIKGWKEGKVGDMIN